MTAIINFSQAFSMMSEGNPKKNNGQLQLACKASGITLMNLHGSDIPGTEKFVGPSTVELWLRHKCNSTKTDGPCECFWSGGYAKLLGITAETSIPDGFEDARREFERVLTDIQNGDLVCSRLTIDTPPDIVRKVRDEFEGFDYSEVLKQEKSWLLSGEAGVIFSFEVLLRTWLALVLLIAVVVHPLYRWAYGDAYEQLTVPIIGFVSASVVPALLGDEKHVMALAGYRRLTKLSQYSREVGSLHGAVALVLARTKWNYRFRGDYSCAFSLGKELHEWFEVDVPVPIPALLAMGAKVVRTSRLEGITSSKEKASKNGYFSRHHQEVHTRNRGEEVATKTNKARGWHDAMLLTHEERYGKEYCCESNWFKFGLHTPVGILEFDEQRSSGTWHLKRSPPLAFITGTGNMEISSSLVGDYLRNDELISKNTHHVQGIDEILNDLITLRTERMARLAIGRGYGDTKLNEVYQMLDVKGLRKLLDHIAEVTGQTRSVVTKIITAAPIDTRWIVFPIKKKFEHYTLDMQDIEKLFKPEHGLATVNLILAQAAIKFPREVASLKKIVTLITTEPLVAQFDVVKFNMKDGDTSDIELRQLGFYARQAKNRAVAAYVRADGAVSY